MNHGVILFTGLIGALGQYAKSHTSYPNWLAQGAMLGLGFLLYWGNNHGPVTHDFAGITDWIEAALLSSASIPGVASIIGSTFPQLKTDSK